MAKDGKTEQATPRKRKLEREKGNLARSKEMANFLSLLAFFVVIFVFGTKMVESSIALVNNSFNMIVLGQSPSQFILNGFKRVFMILVPIMIIGTFFHIANYMLQVGFLFSWKIIKPNFKKLVNFKGYATELISRRKVVEVLRSFALLILFGVISYYVLKGKISLMAGSIWLPWSETLENIIDIFQLSFGTILFAMFVIGLGDYFYQRWEYAQKIMMKKDEVKDESKNAEGSPEVKRRRKELMYALLQRDVTNKVPEATVIINNPTHISVALRYVKGQDDLPIVVAKGEEQLALYIRTLAKKHKVPMVENKPLARSIYYSVEVNDYIQEDMFEAVAEVLRRLIETNQIKL